MTTCPQGSVSEKSTIFRELYNPPYPYERLTPRYTIQTCQLSPFHGEISPFCRNIFLKTWRSPRFVVYINPFFGRFHKDIHGISYNLPVLPYFSPFFGTFFNDSPRLDFLRLTGLELKLSPVRLSTLLC